MLKRSMASMNEPFRRFAAGTSCVLGTPCAFLLAIAFVLVWAATGSYFGYSDAWQLVINTMTTIGTFLMVFLLQSTQNRDTKAINIKLDDQSELPAPNADLRGLISATATIRW